MNQKVKIALALTVGFTIGFAIAKAISTPSQADDDTINSEKLEEEKNRTVTDNAAEESNDEFPLKLGSTGQRVKRLQIYLMRQLGWVRQPNGEFDLLTKERTQKCFKKDQIGQELYEQLMLDKMVHDQRKKKAA